MYPAEVSQLAFWGNDHLDTLLWHYGVRLHNVGGQPFNPLVNDDTCRGEFLPFKRLMHAHRGVETEDGFTFCRPMDGLECIFSGDQKGHLSRLVYGNSG